MAVNYGNGMVKMNNEIEYKLTFHLEGTDIQVDFRTHKKEEYDNIKKLAHFLSEGYIEIMRDKIHIKLDEQFKETDYIFKDVY